MILNFDGWPRKIYFYTTSIFVNHFKSVGEFKLELQSGNLKFGLILAIFSPVWLWHVMGDLGKQWDTSSLLNQALCIISKPSVNSKLNHSPETFNSGQIGDFFVSCGLHIWRMTLKNNRALLLCCFKFCASFYSHQWIQTWVTFRKHKIWVKIDDFF